MLNQKEGASPSGGDATAITVCDAVQRALLTRRDVVLERLGDARHKHGDQAELVHQLRVSSRRAEAALDFLLPWLPPKKCYRLQRQLKKLRQAAGRVRDCDVLEALQRNRPDEARRELKVRLKRRRKACERKLAQVVAHCQRNDRLARLWQALLEKASEESQKLQGSAAPFLPWATEQLGLWLTEFGDSAPAALDSVLQMHAFRIAGKRLRYALELFPEDGHPQTVADLLTLLKDCQDRLGAVCDQEALRVRLEKWASHAHGKAAKRLTAEAAKTAAEVTTSLESLRRDWPAALQRLTDLRARLASAS